MNVLLIRPSRNASDSAALLAHGIETTTSPYSFLTSLDNQQGTDRLMAALAESGEKWFVGTSVNAIDALESQVGRDVLVANLAADSVRFGAVGDATAERLRTLANKDVLVAPERDSASLAQAMLAVSAARAVVPAGMHSNNFLVTELASQGVEVTSEPIYAVSRVLERPDAYSAVESGAFTGVLLRSASSAAHFLEFHPQPKIAIYCVGESASNFVTNRGHQAALNLRDPNPETVAMAISKLESGTK